MTLRILPPEPVCPGQRLVVKSGDVTVGAIFPPAKDGGIWRWRLWLIDTAAHTLDGASKTQAQAETAIRARWSAFLERAGLKADDDTPQQEAQG